MDKLWTDVPSALLQRSLDVAAEKHRVTSHNVANVNTPNFKRQEVVFADELKKAIPLARTNPRHLSGADVKNKPFRVITDSSSSMRTDGNNVDIDREMALLAMNQMNFSALTQILNQRYSLLRYVISEGRR